MARKVEVSGITGPIWFAGWLFTIGYVHLGFWKAVLALVIWPYYLGALLRA
jgi:uncharacterized membrane protein